MALSIQLHSRSNPHRNRNIHRTRDSILLGNNRAFERTAYLSVFHVVGLGVYAFQTLSSLLKPSAA